MTCSSCGCDLSTGALFCVRCGKPQAVVDSPTWQQPLSFTPDPQARVTRNLQALGIGWCLYGVYQLLAAHLFSWSHHPHGLGAVLCFALPVLAGLGLLSRKRWARGLALFLGLCALFTFPVGTVLGVYTFWALGSCAARKEWRRLQVTSSC